MPLCRPRPDRQHAGLPLPGGADLLGRIEGFFKWQNLRRQHGLWPFSRSTDEGPPRSARRVTTRRKIRGVNFASQDYLSLSSHPADQGGRQGDHRRFGVHSAGSPALVGNTSLLGRAGAQDRRLPGMEEAVLFPTGWAAGFGVIKGLVRSTDHVVMDALAHTCLQEGASAATRNIHLFRHPTTNIAGSC